MAVYLILLPSKIFNNQRILIGQLADNNSLPDNPFVVKITTHIVQNQILRRRIRRIPGTPHLTMQKLTQNNLPTLLHPIYLLRRLVIITQPKILQIHRRI